MFRRDDGGRRETLVKDDKEGYIYLDSAENVLY